LLLRQASCKRNRSPSPLRIRDLWLVILEYGLILRGRAKNYHAKQLAQHAVMETSRVRILANEIEVS
jgi:hypothetical protein